VSDLPEYLRLLVWIRPPSWGQIAHRYEDPPTRPFEAWRVRVRRIEGEHRVFAQEAMRRDRELLEENRAAVGLGPLGAEWEKDQARVYGLEGGGGVSYGDLFGHQSRWR
jgi:hypothetical protein